MNEVYEVLPPGLPGQSLACLVIDESRVVIKPSLNQVESFVVDPRHTENPKRVAEDFWVREASKMRQRVQRLLSSNKAKRDNVPAYARYLVDGLVKGEDYVTPPQCLVFTTRLKIYRGSDAPDSATFLNVPPGARAIHADGETQYLARLAARNDHPETGDVPLAVVVDHSRTIEWGGQAFHDLNLLGVPVSAAVAIAADSRDTATKLAKQMAATIPVLVNKVSSDARQVSAKTNAIMTITTLRRATAASLIGRKVFSLGNKPLTEEVSEEEKNDIPLLWRRVFAALEPHLNHGTVVGLPVVLTAIGIAVHDARARENGLDSLLHSLEPVQWDKSTEKGAQRWAGIAGKLTDSGRFSAAGGVKDLGHRVLEALTDPQSNDYMKIRQF